MSSKAKAGYVAIMYGSASGLSTAKKQIVSRSTAGVPGSATASQRFGSAFTKGDLDKDGYTDLVIMRRHDGLGRPVGLRLRAHRRHRDRRVRRRARGR